MEDNLYAKFQFWVFWQGILRWVTKNHIYLTRLLNTPYVCNEQTFEGLQFALNKKKFKQKMNEWDL